MNLQVYYRYLSSHIASRWTILTFDLLIVILSIFVAYVLQNGLSFLSLDSNVWLWTVSFCVLLNSVFFHIFRTYVGIIRYSSFIDIFRIFISLSLAYGSLGTVNIIYSLLTNVQIIPNSLILMAYIINLAIMVASRIFIKLIYELVTFDYKHSINVFIYSVEGAGINIAKSLQVNRHNRYKLRGFISDDPRFIGKQTMGCKVFANDNRLFDIFLKYKIKSIIVSPNKIKDLEDSGMIDQLISSDIRVLTVPPIDEWKDGKDNDIQIKDIQIEDLLNREPIQINIRKISSNIEGKRVMITGAAGSIGSELARQIAALNPFQLILIDQAETPLHYLRLELHDEWRNVDARFFIANVNNRKRIEKIFEQYPPHYVFHAAAYKHVPMMEDNVSEAIQTNLLGTCVMADLAVKYKVNKFVMVSTDKAVNPTNVMGCSKRLAEIYVQSLARKLSSEKSYVRFITTRFGNVLGSNGSVIPRFKQQIENGGPVTVTHPNIIRYFMTIPEACNLVLEAGCMGNGAEIYLFDMGDPVKIVDLAKRMIYLSGRKNIKIEYTGLRHGEKLYEELLNVKEYTYSTHHEKIMIADVCEYDYDEIKDKIKHLIEISYSANSVEIVTAMKEFVPEFISKNSKYEILDKVSL